MQEAGESFLATLENLIIAAADFRHFLSADLAIMQGRAPIGRALEHHKLLGDLSDFLNGLHAGCASANHRHALAGEIHLFLGPKTRVKRLTLEIRNTRKLRHGRRGKRTNRGDQKARFMRAAIFQCHGPAACLFIPARRLHARLELDIAAQIVFIGDQVQIAFGFRLRREMLGPMPFLQQILVEGIAIRIAFRIEAAARIAVPIPGAANTRACFKHARLHAQLAQPDQLIEPGHAGTDDNGIIIEPLVAARRPVRFHHCAHVVNSHPFQVTLALKPLYSRKYAKNQTVISLPYVSGGDSIRIRICAGGKTEPAQNCPAFTPPAAPAHPRAAYPRPFPRS